MECNQQTEYFRGFLRILPPGFGPCIRKSAWLCYLGAGVHQGASHTRLLLSSVSSVMVGIYLAVEFLPGEKLVQVRALHFVVVPTTCIRLQIKK
jgi:hypothetical protein